ncbi:SMI1/KNR4 family protein [Rhodococcus maanshanensis]|uniref:Knr4/Smi1-like domain-containing protein n=1 Tax=Rhodococcus maanshanensis TaxID=183556 RepID=A0A1H7GJG5_9NOCA|nr:SMI1/KNR4 family protein [Rhodococcus maanshanensis]SEK37677.1 hypothetical protein SAMN05444583_101488 [Rhodococcus maanshanensis]
MSITEHWSRITEWCVENAPLTAQSIAGPAGRAEIDSAQAATGAEWPDELRELFLVQNGARTHTDSGQFLGSVLPDKFMLSLEDALERRSLMLEVWEDLVAADPDFYEPDAIARCEAQEAGTTAYMYLPSFVVFASLDDYHYFVDTRAGSRRGCVTEYAHEAVDERGPRWDSISDLLAELASSLEQGTPFESWEPGVVDGALRWTFRA